MSGETMKRKNILAFLLVMAALAAALPAAAQQKEKARELIYTFIGPVMTGGFNHLYQSDWYGDTNRQDQRDYTGAFVSGGFIISLFMEQFTGDFSMQYMHNFNKPGELYHLFYTVNGKWLWKVSNPFHITMGLGLYFETPPSNRDYNGAAGGQIPIGGVWNTTFDTKLVFDFFVRYGFFGLGEYSSKLCYGLSVAFVFKVGRI
jgi:hypothetical protein